MHLKNLLLFGFAFFGLCFSSSLAQAHIDAYGVILIGATSMDETSGVITYNHSNTFFVGHFGFGGGARFMLDMDRFSLGAIGEISWNGDSLNRKQAGTTSEATYRYESYRLLAGASAAVKLGSLSVIGEYYPWAQNTVTYADEKSENPFRKNDKLKATGFGIGFNYDLGGGFGYSALFRRLTYKDVGLNGTAVTLPSSQYTTLNVDDVAVGFTKSF